MITNARENFARNSNRNICQKKVKQVQAILAGACSSVKRSEVKMEKAIFRHQPGCPLSPYLFIVVMTVLLHDAKEAALHDRGGYDPLSNVVRELVYADDTLGLTMSTASAQCYMNKIVEQGRHYGMSFNWSKLEAMNVRCEGAVRTPDGDPLQKKKICHATSLHVGPRRSSGFPRHRART